jgi:putative flippase GtrA
MSGGQCVRFGKFNLIGALGAGLQIVLFDLLMNGFQIPQLTATPIAVEIAVLHNFFWHERFTWRDRRLGGLRQRSIRLWRFHCGNGLISLVGNTVLTFGLVEGLKSPALPSALLAIAFCAPVNFLIADRWVYGVRRLTRQPNPTGTPSGSPVAGQKA